MAPHSESSALLTRIDPQLLQGALQVARRLSQAGHEALFAGGVVRDLLLERRVSDIDIATSAPPQVIERLFARTIPVGKQFGVMIVLIDDSRYEVATFRRESDYRDGRRPSNVEFSDSRSDALRRDFTVNALFLDPFNQTVIDYVEGRSDLRAGIIRTVGNAAERFEEDRLRVLRAIRFACGLGFRIEAETLEQLEAFAPRLGQVSWERIRDELLKILTERAPARGLRLMLDTGILQVILPEVAAMKGVEQPPEFHPEGDVFEHTALMLEQAHDPDATLALGLLLHDVGKPATFTRTDRIRFSGHVEEGMRLAEEIGRRLRLSNEQRREVIDLVEHHMRFMHVRDMRASKLKRFLRKENFAKHLELHRLDCLSSHRDLSNYEFCRRKLEELAAEPVLPQPLIGGKDLIELGYSPGPAFKEMLGAVEDLQLEGELKTRQDALEWVRANYPLASH